MAASEFTLDSVKEFMLSHGGRVKNHELVTHFKVFLNDPDRKAEMRDKFKDFVNTLATIKVDEQHDKILVLKRKYRPENQGDTNQEMFRASSEPPGGPSKNSASVNDRTDGVAPSKMKSDGNLAAFDERLSASVSSSISLGSGVSTSSLSSATVDTAEEDNNVSVVSVKERAKHLNRIESETELMHQTSSSSLGAVRKNIKESKKIKDREDDDSSTGSGYVTLDPKEKEWLVVSSSADYHAMHQLLSKQPELARVKDFTSISGVRLWCVLQECFQGMGTLQGKAPTHQGLDRLGCMVLPHSSRLDKTALHWASKHGRPEVIKMLIGKPGVNVNQKTGYTPLHLAAIHGHEEVIELLIQTFKADPNIRDYSGKKPKQYLKNSASSRAQQLLVSSRLSSTSKGRDSGNTDENFTRNSSGRRSNRARAISSLIQASAAGFQNAMLRRSTEDVNNTTPRSTPTSSPRNSAEPSPVSRRKGSFTRDHDMMPPPSAPYRRTKKPYSISKESLMTEDKRHSSGKQVPRSESEPNLGEVTQPSKTTFI